MDSVTHSLLGAALAKTRLGSASPLAPVGLVVAASLPDFENVVLAFYDEPTNMIHHRSITHAVVGVALLIPLFTLLVWRLERGWCRRPARGSPGLLALGIGLAVASHPLLDWLNTYGVRPWLPWDWTWYHGDLVFIVDPWIWLLLGGAIAVAGKRTWWGSIALGVLGVLLSIPVLLAAGFTPAALQVVWPLALLVFVVARWQSLGARRPNTVVATAVALAAAYVGFLGWAGRTAWEQSRPVIAAQLAPGESIIARTISPQPADPLRWQIIAETERAVYRHTFSILDAPGGAVRLAKNLDRPLVQQLADTPRGRAWRIFARHPVAAVATIGDHQRVYLMDARYPMFPARGFSSFTIDVPHSGSAAARAAVAECGSPHVRPTRAHRSRSTDSRGQLARARFRSARRHAGSCSPPEGPCRESSGAYAHGRR